MFAQKLSPFEFNEKSKFYQVGSNQLFLSEITQFPSLFQPPSHVTFDQADPNVPGIAFLGGQKEPILCISSVEMLVVSSPQNSVTFSSEWVCLGLQPKDRLLVRKGEEKEKENNNCGGEENWKVLLNTVEI